MTKSIWQSRTELQNGHAFRPKPHAFSKMGPGSFVYLEDQLVTPPATAQKLYLSVEINEDCPLHCYHCIYKRQTTMPPLSENELLAWLKRGQEDHVEVTWTSISGKEPLATPQFCQQIAESARSISKKQIVMTNAFLLSQEVGRSIAPFIDYADISLDGIEEVHNSIRGEGAFSRTWSNLQFAYDANWFDRIGVITTLHTKNFHHLTRLLDLINSELRPLQNRLQVCVNFYVGWPHDPLRLSYEQVIDLLHTIKDHPLKTKIPLPGSYTHMAAGIIQELGLNLESLRYDLTTGIPSIDFNGHKIVLLNLVAHESCMLRISHDGLIYYGCVHLMKDGRVDEFQIGDVRRDSLSEVARRVFDEEVFPHRLFRTDTGCESNDCYPYCLGGDRIAGHYYAGVPKDPFCPTIN